MSYRTVLIENNRMMLERLSSVIRNSPGFELSARYQTAGDALGQMQAFSPNLILLDIDCEPNVSLLSDLKKNCGQALIICLSRRWDSEAQARLLRGGAQGYMIKPFTPDELQAAVRNADRASLRSSARVISFFSPKGKSGKTTLISNLAASIAKRTGEPVAILDCDLQFGDMAVFFNLNPQTTLVEAVRDIKFLSPVTLKSYFIDARRNLQILCGPAKPDLAESVTLDALTQLIHMTRSLYSYVLIDLPSGFSDISATACELSDETVLMAMYNGGYETMHMKRALEIFKAWDDYQERVYPLFTRVSPFDDAEKERLSKELGYPVAAIIPNEYVRVSEAADNGRLVVDENPDSPFAKAVDTLAEKIISK